MLPTWRSARINSGTPNRARSSTKQFVLQDRSRHLRLVWSARGPGAGTRISSSDSGRVDHSRYSRPRATNLHLVSYAACWDVAPRSRTSSLPGAYQCPRRRTGIAPRAPHCRYCDFPRYLLLTSVDFGGATLTRGCRYRTLLGKMRMSSTQHPVENQNMPTQT